MGMFVPAEASCRACAEFPRGITKWKGTPLTYRDTGTVLCCCVRPVPANPATIKRQSSKRVLLDCTSTSTESQCFGPAVLTQHSLGGRDQGANAPPGGAQVFCSGRDVLSSKEKPVAISCSRSAEKCIWISAGSGRAPFAVKSPFRSTGSPASWLQHYTRTKDSHWQEAGAVTPHRPFPDKPYFCHLSRRDPSAQGPVHRKVARHDAF